MCQPLLAEQKVILSSSIIIIGIVLTEYKLSPTYAR